LTAWPSTPAKVQQNISGRLTSEKRTQDRCTIRGYLSTAAKHGHNVMTAMRPAITGDPWMPPLHAHHNRPATHTDAHRPDRSSPCATNKCR
jgi:hypothetical protein